MTASPEGLVLRPMRWWDVAAVAELEVSAFPATAWSAESFWSELAGVPGTRHYLVAEVDGRLVGYAGLAVTPPDADIQTIAVAAAQRGQGVGAALLTRLLDEAQDRGCRRVFLEVAADNDAAQRLYERHGFTLGHRRRHYYGPDRDALVMTRRAPGATP